MILSLLVLILAIVLLYQAYSLKAVYRLTKIVHKTSPKVDGSSIPPVTHFPLNPYSKETSLVLDVKKIEVDHPDAYNASFVKDSKNQGWLFYRVDEFPKFGVHKSFIHCQKIDKDFKKVGQSYFVSPQLGDSAEDPRVFLKNNSLYCLYNEPHPQNKKIRTVSLSVYDEAAKQLVPQHRALLNIQKVEKNWSPVLCDASMNDLSLVYSLSPLTVIKADFENKMISHPFQSEETSPSLFPEYWIEKYGAPRGGTPAIQLGEHYLTFFHSSFVNKADHRIWYVMGACLFSSSRPHKIISVSKAPILFDSIYDTKITNRFGLRKCVLFPVSVVKEGNLLHVCCGENDSGIKMVTIDQNKLLKSLKSI